MAIWKKVVGALRNRPDEQKDEFDRDAEARFTSESGNGPSHDAVSGERQTPSRACCDADDETPSMPPNPADFTHDQAKRPDTPI